MEDAVRRESMKTEGEKKEKHLATPHPEKFPECSRKRKSKVGPEATKECLYSPDYLVTTQELKNSHDASANIQQFSVADNKRIKKVSGLWSESIKSCHRHICPLQRDKKHLWRFLVIQYIFKKWF